MYERLQTTKALTLYSASKSWKWFNPFRSRSEDRQMYQWHSKCGYQLLKYHLAKIQINIVLTLKENSNQIFRSSTIMSVFLTSSNLGTSYNKSITLTAKPRLLPKLATVWIFIELIMTTLSFLATNQGCKQNTNNNNNLNNVKIYC